MAYEISWYHQDRVLYVRFWDNLTLDEAQQISAINTRHLAEGTPPVHIVVDITQLQTFPTNIRFNTGVTSYLKSSNLGWVVVVGEMNALLNFALAIIGQFARIMYTRRDSLESALEFLQKRDSTLSIHA